VTAPPKYRKHFFLFRYLQKEEYCVKIYYTCRAHGSLPSPLFSFSVVPFKDKSSLDQRPSLPEWEQEPDIQPTDQGCGLDLTSGTSPTREAADHSADLIVTTESVTIIPERQEPDSEPSISGQISAQDLAASDT